MLRLLKGDGIKIHLFSKLSPDVLRPGGFESAPAIQDWIDERVQRDDGLFTVVNDGNKLCVTGED